MSLTSHEEIGRVGEDVTRMLLDATRKPLSWNLGYSSLDAGAVWMMSSQLMSRPLVRRRDLERYPTSVPPPSPPPPTNQHPSWLTLQTAEVWTCFASPSPTGRNGKYCNESVCLCVGPGRWKFGVENAGVENAAAVYSRIFYACNFARIAFFTPTFSVAPSVRCSFLPRMLPSAYSVLY